MKNRIKTILYPIIIFSLLLVTNCSLLTKKELSNLEENDWFKIEQVHFQVKNKALVWEIGITWKEKGILNLRIVDSTHDILIYEGSSPKGQNSTILGSPIRPEDQRYSWIFQDKNKPSQILIQIEAEDLTDARRSAEKLIRISPETKHSLYHKSKDP